MDFIMKAKVVIVLSLFFLSSLSPLFATAEAENSTGIEILDTAVNPQNNHTYHLLSASSWEDAADAARGLDGFLTTINDEAENQWIFDTFSTFDNQSRHLWTGLSSSGDDGYYKWHDGAPFYYNNWGDSQPSQGGDEDFVHIASTNMGNIMPGTWNDLENDPQYFPVYGVVEVGEGADFSLRFNGDGDKIVVPHSDSLNISGGLHLSAWVFPYTTQGIQFITMKGDYGWGMYLNNGAVGYASEYSLSKHPLSNMTIAANQWNHIEIELVESVGGQFTINGEHAGNISAENSMIPQGDFGSNDCFTSGDSCDELFIASMGAGCDCNFFEGLLDNISIGSSAVNTTTNWISNWTFAEGEGSITSDNVNNTGEIHGADWVMPDGTIVMQAVELLNDEDITIDSVDAGDQLLFYADIEDMTKEMYLNMFAWGQFEKEPIDIDVYISHESIPSSWDHDDHFVAEFSYLWEDWSWPDTGTWWFVIIPTEDVEDLTITLTWVVADPPPELSEMTELKNSIPVTDQSIDVGRQAPLDERILYYYVNVTEPLASLSVETYDGTGNINLGLSWLTVPDPFDLFDDFFFGEDDSEDISSKLAWSTGPGNEEIATLYDVEPGTYYVSAFTYGRALDYTIRASFAYAPDNVEPEDAIELSPGIEYGPLSGYDGLMQYFKIDVPASTERLEVDLSEGYGEATLFLQYLEAPDVANFDYRSGSPGAGDMVGFNDPAPGMWYILVYTDEIFANVMITASFEDRYVWSYDGTPIELFNGEEISGIEAPAGQELFFFVQLEEPGEYLEITSFGGEGELLIKGAGEQITFNFEDGFEQDGGGGGGGPGGRQMPGVDLGSEAINIESFGEGTEQSIFVEMPSNGRFDITLYAKEAFSDVSLVANWEYADLPPVLPGEPDEPVDTMSCEDHAKESLTQWDKDKDGVLSIREFESIGDEDVVFSEIDLNSDDTLEYREIMHELCACDNELQNMFDQLERFDSVSIESFSEQYFVNEYEFTSFDADRDGELNGDEIEIAILVCETTFDAFDGDKDGVPDDEDAFPDDPDETLDSDGDGVGDNADIAPGVANDMLYSAGAGLFFLLIGILVFFLRSGSNDESSREWEDSNVSDFDERMLQKGDKEIPAIEQFDSSMTSPPTASENVSPFAAYSAPPMESVPDVGDVSDLFVSSVPQSPPSALMGMIDSSGQEVIEYPAGSGAYWKRSDASQEWSQQ
tara:strand:+ start:2370 stop:6005 length:3636 start_codon:yes stop_codon:yes gene_type:complete